MKVLSIGTDRNIFDAKSAVRQRMIEYGALVEELHLLVFSRGHYFRREKISANVWVYPTNSIARLFYFFDAWRVGAEIIGKEKFLISTQDPFETGVVGALLAKKFGLKIQMQIHTDIFSTYYGKFLLNKIRLLVGRYVIRYADGVRVVRERIKSDLVRLWAVPEVKIAVLPIYVDITRIETEPIRENIKEKYPKFEAIVLMASRLTVEKNIPLALAAQRKILETRPKTGLVIVGDGPLRGKLKDMVRHLGIGESVVFERWRQDLVSYYKTADIFLLTSYYEGYGMTIVEAAAARIPIVTTEVGIAGEVVVDGVSGFLCPLDDSDCVAKKILKLIQSAELRERFAASAEKKIRSILTEDKQNYLKKYKMLLHKTYV